MAADTLMIAKDYCELFRNRANVAVNPVLFDELDNYFTTLLNANNNAVMYEMNYNTKGRRWPEHYTGKLTTVHKNTITFKVIEGHGLLTIDRYWNVYNYPYERYFKYKGALYYHQPAKTNEWGQNIPELYTQIIGNPQKLIDDIDESIVWGKSLKTTKESLRAIGNFLSVGDHFVETFNNR